MQEGKVAVPRLAKCTTVRCVFHAHDARYRIKFFEDDELFIIECIACQPPTEIVRCRIDNRPERKV